MHKIAVRVITGLVVSAVVCGGIYGGLTVYRNSQVKPVSVFEVADVVMPADYFMEDSQAYGSVYADRIHSVFISGTQNVKEVLVTTGQEVKKGDPLMTYDTTLTAIQLEKAENELAQQELALKRAEEDLEKIKRLVPHEEDEDYGEGFSDEVEEPEKPEPTPKPVKYEPQPTAVRIRGAGTRENPYIYLWSSQDALTNEQLLAMFTESGTYTYTDDPEVTEANFEEEAVETAPAELRIMRNFGLLPLTVWGDEELPPQAVEVGVEVEEESTPDGGDSTVEVEPAPQEIEAGEADAQSHAVEFEVMPDDRTDDFPPEHVEITIAGEEEGEPEATDSVEEGIEIGEEVQFSEGEEPVVVVAEAEETPTPSGSTGIDYSFLDGTPNEVFVVLEIHQDDNINAPRLLGYGLHLIRDGHRVAVRLYDPDGSSQSENEEVETIDDEALDDEDVFLGGGGAYDDEYYDDEEEEEDSYAPSLNESAIDFEASYTAKEIEEMRIDKEKEIRDETISYKIAAVNLREMKQEMGDGTIRSKVSGVVKTVRDPDDAYKNSEAVIVVSGGGGYTVGISVSELELDSLAVDQQVTITSFDNETEFLGYVSSISDFPTTNIDGWSMGNPNVSYYPCVVNVADDAELREGDYVSVKYSGAEQVSGNTFYMEKMYVRSDSSGRYVYVRDKADGLLKKRYIVTGKSPDSYVIEIRGGLTEGDYIAFPYGKDIVDGAPTQQGSIDDLYG